MSIDLGHSPMGALVVARERIEAIGEEVVVVVSHDQRLCGWRAHVPDDPVRPCSQIPCAHVAVKMPPTHRRETLHEQILGPSLAQTRVMPLEDAAEISFDAVRVPRVVERVAGQGRHLVAVKRCGEQSACFLDDGSLRGLTQQPERTDVAKDEYARVVVTGLRLLGSCHHTFFSRSVSLKNREDPVERVRGIEPPSPAWEAGALPLSYTRGMGNPSGMW